MQFSYGSYQHEDNEVGMTIEYRSIFDKFSRRMGEVATYHIVGVKQASSQGALTGALNGLELAYNKEFQDISFKDNGDSETQHSLTDDSTWSGVQVAHFGYPSGSWDMQTEYGSGGNCKRTFHIILTAEKRFGSGFYAFRERITQIGTGGAKRKYMPSLAGSPELQTLRAETPIRYIQEGYVIGRKDRLVPPTPSSALGIEMLDQRMITINTPEDIRANGNQEMFQTNYRYVFEALSIPTYDLYDPTIAKFVS